MSEKYKYPPCLLCGEDNEGSMRKWFGSNEVTQCNKCTGLYYSAKRMEYELRVMDPQEPVQLV